ncbi:MAG: 5-deoxy-glucuronate isomerase, partial [Chitinophagaceae bacterium]|nr:5-deoxy-glucuronate isomerase [Chitinophagaceae bacterium]
MIKSKKYKLVSHASKDFGVYQKISATDAGWTHLNFEARLMSKGETWEGNTGENEYGFILLSGNYSITTDKGNWQTVNGRKDVFSGIAHTLYLPRHTSFSLTAESDVLDIAAGWCAVRKDRPAKFKTPAEAAIEIQGGDNATRQINSLIEPGFGSSKLVA